MTATPALWASLAAATDDDLLELYFFAHGGGHLTALCNLAWDDDFLEGYAHVATVDHVTRLRNDPAVRLVILTTIREAIATGRPPHGASMTVARV